VASEMTRATPARPRDTSRRGRFSRRRSPRSADLKADHLPFSGLRHAVGDDQSHGDHARGVVSHLLVGGIQEDPGVAAEERAAAESLHLLVKQSAHAGDLALRDTVDAEGVRHFFHLARRDAAYVGLSDDGEEGFFCPAARLEEAGEIAPFPQLRDEDGKGTDAGVQPILAVPLCMHGRSGLRSPKLAPVLTFTSISMSALRMSSAASFRMSHAPRRGTR
jgi:hypothetical protein